MGYESLKSNSNEAFIVAAFKTIKYLTAYTYWNAINCSYWTIFPMGYDCWTLLAEARFIVLSAYKVVLLCRFQICPSFDDLTQSSGKPEQSTSTIGTLEYSHNYPG